MFEQKCLHRELNNNAIRAERRVYFLFSTIRFTVKFELSVLIDFFFTKMHPCHCVNCMDYDKKYRNLDLN